MPTTTQATARQLQEVTVLVVKAQKSDVLPAKLWMNQSVGDRRRGRPNRAAYTIARTPSSTSFQHLDSTRACREPGRRFASCRHSRPTRNLDDSDRLSGFNRRAPTTLAALIRCRLNLLAVELRMQSAKTSRKKLREVVAGLSRGDVVRLKARQRLALASLDLSKLAEQMHSGESGSGTAMQHLDASELLTETAEGSGGGPSRQRARYEIQTPAWISSAKYTAKMKPWLEQASTPMQQSLERVASSSQKYAEARSRIMPSSQTHNADRAGEAEQASGIRISRLSKLTLASTCCRASGQNDRAVAAQQQRTRHRKMLRGSREQCIDSRRYCG